MRGNRTWFALVINWLTVGGLLIAGKFGVFMFIAGIVIILLTWLIVNGEMKWWRKDLVNMDLLMGEVQRRQKQVTFLAKGLDDETLDANMAKSSE